MNADAKQKLLDDYKSRRAEAEELADKRGITEQEALDELSGPDDFPKAETVYAFDERSLWVHERSDRPGTVRVRWQSTDEEIAAGAPSRPKLTVDVSERVRDDRGRLRKRGWQRAVEKAKETYRETIEPAEDEDDSDEFETMDAVLRYFVDPETGRSRSADGKKDVGVFPIPTKHNTHLAEVYRYINPKGLHPSRWGIEHARKIWRGIEGAREGGAGARWAEMVVSTVHAAHNYAALNGKIPAEGGLPKHWRQELRDDWSARTGVSTDPSRESYNVDEVRKLMSGLADDHDETNRLVLVLGAGFRSGQVARYAKRSGLSDTGPFGKRLTFYDKKAGQDVVIDLAPRQQRILRHAMEDGVLSELERAYNAKAIDDYYLIAGGRRKDGKAQPKHSGAPLHKRQVRKRFAAYEERCGVEHIDGRLYHGLRRALEELIGEETTDDKVRDAAQGWTIGGGTRAAVYADRKSERTLEKAAVARASAIEKVSSEQTPAERVDEVMLAAERLHRDLLDIGEDLEGDGLGPVIDGAVSWIQTLRETAEALADDGGEDDQETEAA